MLALTSLSARWTPLSSITTLPLHRRSASPGSKHVAAASTAPPQWLPHRLEMSGMDVGRCANQCPWQARSACLLPRCNPAGLEKHGRPPLGVWVWKHPIRSALWVECLPLKQQLNKAEVQLEFLLAAFRPHPIDSSMHRTSNDHQRQRFEIEV